jgi:type I restriction-modification system DNA methylase subunit
MDFNSKWVGQYFSPQYICNMMAKIAFGDPKEIIERRGYICVEEPCCGSGAMLLGMAGTMLEPGYNYQQQCLVHATDIDLKCIHMCYIQLALRGIPAIIVHGNALSQEEYSRWYTPQFVLGGWAERLNLERTRDGIMEIMRGLKQDVPRTQDCSRQDSPEPLTIIFSETPEGQLTLF